MAWYTWSTYKHVRMYVHSDTHTWMLVKIRVLEQQCVEGHDNHISLT